MSSALGQSSRMRTDGPATSVHDSGRGVPELPAEGVGFGLGEMPGEAEQLEPADEVGSEADQGHLGPVGVEVGEGEPFESGGLEPADVVLDVGVGPHVGVGGVVGSWPGYRRGQPRKRLQECRVPRQDLAPL